jgi:uncharacterized protein (DUF952 family)
MMSIYHIAFAGDWSKAVSDGEYRVSTRGRSLEEQGFIHAGTASQVAPVANAIYKRGDDLVVLVIDTGRLVSELRYDDVPGWDEPFPHIYGPINIDAVVGTRPLQTGPDGRFSFAVTAQPESPLTP